MNIKTYCSILCASVLCAGGSLSYAQSTGDNATGTVANSTDAGGTKVKTEAMPEKDGVTMYKKSVYVVKDGVATKVTEKMEVADGLVVDSMSITKNGTKVTLMEGQMMTFDGNMIEAPKDIMDRASQTGQGAVTEKP